VVQRKVVVVVKGKERERERVNQKGGKGKGESCSRLTNGAVEMVAGPKLFCFKLKLKNLNNLKLKI